MSRVKQALRDWQPLSGGPVRVREQAHRDAGAAVIAGVDEAGRGAVAGPVVAAAVVLDPQRCPDGLDDSKRLSPAQRLALYEQILNAAACVAVHIISPRRIDEINILQASREAMRRAILGLAALPDIALVDGLPVPSFPCPHEPIIGGDGLECAIAAASIIAKVTRDSLMIGYGAHYPIYGFESHKGYATPAHRRAIRDHGLTPIHRRSFTRSIVSPGIGLEL